jgi:hypothetical protein
MLNFLKNRYSLLIIFLIIVLLATFIYFVLIKKETEETLEPLEKEQLTLEKYQLSKYPEEFILEQLEKEGAKIYHHTPLTKENCQKEEDEHKKELCLDKLKLVNTIKENNIKACLKFKKTELRDDCLKELIPYTFNDDLCFAISDKGKRKTCLSRIIVNSRNDNLCEKYFKGEPFEIKECKDRVAAFKIAETKENDIYKCKEVDTLEYHNLCLIGSFTKKFNNDCSKVPQEFKDYCFAKKYLSEAKTKEDCSLIKLPNYQKFCLLKIEAGNDLNKISQIDSDNDGFSDNDELFYRLDPYNPDTDGDGLKDGEELGTYHTNPAKKDSDEDSLSDYEEVMIYKTNPNRFDTDGDGIWDAEEVKNKTHLKIDGDKDKDDLADELESKFGTDPNNPDTDSDGYLDGKEIKYGYNPLGEGLADTDSDGLLDIDEIFYGTDRFNPDTDNDGINDKKEVDDLTNPLGSGDMDFDGDGLTDKEEEKYKTNPSLPDTDGDGYLDGEEVKNGYNPLGEGRME